MSSANSVLYIFCLLFAVLNGYAQQVENGNEPDNIRQLYENALAEYNEYERIHGGFIKTKNVDLHYLEWGNPEDTPLIWVHGSFTNAYELADFADTLVKNGYYIIAIDYYGHGKTTIPAKEVSLYHVADDINTLMTEKGINKAIIGGWSRGGIIATAFYDTYPNKAMGLILEDGGSVSTNTHYHKMDDSQLTNRVKDIFKDRIEYPKLDSQFEAYRAFYDQSAGGNQFKLLAWLSQEPNGQWTIGSGVEELFNMANEKQFLNTILRPTQSSLFGESMAIIEPKIIYRNLNIPMLILDPMSDNDIFPYEEENKALAKQHPALITHKIFQNTGHNVHYERPNEFIKEVGLFLSVVKDFWSKN
ncbi:alpha/beta fold hydrolase [Roseivirga misakiensis]|uniref:AB hydrolase-1 domain-containing protein n=1 Tax=Roseivirga misakiensis TaxID=1563681 RepID=A0A1E5SK25_9BACT|nr:alpha/beta hydrolase [Roseivirga misakiensis]OEJ99475.1 hypothetical protein BFP71_07775 [Roseivirga misakiensis]